MIKSLIIPLLVFAFFAIAPRWLDRNLHQAIGESISASTQMSAADRQRQLAALARLKIADVCGSTAPEYSSFRVNLERAGVCTTFARLSWSLYLAGLLLFILLGAEGAMMVLNQRARHSPADLIRAYRVSWKVGMFAAIAQVFLLLPLLAFGTFELTVLATESYYPKLLLAIVVGGIYALWKSAGILLKRVPLEFEEPLSRALTPEEAPELWQAVRAAAARLNTAPPDRILVGMQFNFYVTELAVNHGDGRAEGRTLYLSYPLMRHLSGEEVIAIIGHELGHFIGEDTRLTREFYPLRMKVNATMFSLAQSGVVAWTSLWLLEFFAWTFGTTEQSISRQRELLADAKAAELTSPLAIARSLVRFHAILEAFQLGLADPARRKEENPLELPVRSVIRDKLVPRANFWNELFEKHTPHPLDSHPALHVRVEALGLAITPADAQAMALAEGVSAYDGWFAQREMLFAKLATDAGVAFGKTRVQAQVAQADAGTEMGRQLLQEHFPERRWRTKFRRLAFLYVICGLLIPIIGILTVAKPTGGVILGALAACAFLGRCLWVARERHRNAELVLTPDGLTYTGWNRPLAFADVETLSATNQYSSITITFRLKTKQPSRWRYALPLERRTLTLNVSGFDEKGSVMLQEIYRYLTRQVVA